MIFKTYPWGSALDSPKGASSHSHMPQHYTRPRGHISYKITRVKNPPIILRRENTDMWSLDLRIKYINTTLNALRHSHALLLPWRNRCNYLLCTPCKLRTFGNIR